MGIQIVDLTQCGNVEFGVDSIWEWRCRMGVINNPGVGSNQMTVAECGNDGIEMILIM